jgi:hypothetical protein
MYQVWVQNRSVLGHIPGAALRSEVLLLSEGVNVNSRHTSEFQDGCTLCRRVRRHEPHCISKSLSILSKRLSHCCRSRCKSQTVAGTGIFLPV